MLGLGVLYGVLCSAVRVLSKDKQRFGVLCGCCAVLYKQAKVLLCVGAKQG